ncbi:DNA ligase [Paenibacillus alginolyticus]|uniref:ATP-dependent DNA ligase n=1 Tax=Paenibacillus alginolyticus TaxID=59839 RepID=UPI0004239600|nr:RNA ligase family protein [Paenibacillus alginolyticus]MCY9665878.1 DNA ligase [Paenibacillus alginolyticus]
MFIPPMLLQYAKNNEPFDGISTFAELKWDGIRLIVSNMEEINLYTKNTNATAKYPELHNPPIPKGTILDGEIVVLDEQGRADFEETNAGFRSSKKRKPVVFMAFDILYHCGIDVTGLPLERRKQLLEEILQETEHYRIVRPIKGSAKDFYKIVCQHGLEGIVIKKKDSRYEKGVRSWSWQKVINYQKAEVYITGYSKKESSWLLGYQNGERIRPIGTMELGITQSARESMWPVFRSFKSGESKDYVYIKPVVRCKVKYRDWYKSGAMRLPVFEEFIV